MEVLFINPSIQYSSFQYIPGFSLTGSALTFFLQLRCVKLSILNPSHFSRVMLQLLVGLWFNSAHHETV